MIKELPPHEIRRINVTTGHLPSGQLANEQKYGNGAEQEITDAREPVTPADHRSRFRFNSASILPNGKVLTTSAFVSHPLRAAPMPNCKSCNRSVRCASGSITHVTPFSFARGHQRQSRSSRFGAELSSIHVPVAAAASITAARSTVYASRFNNNRPVG